MQRLIITKRCHKKLKILFFVNLYYRISCNSHMSQFFLRSILRCTLRLRLFCGQVTGIINDGSPPYYHHTQISHLSSQWPYIASRNTSQLPTSASSISLHGENSSFNRIAEDSSQILNKKFNCSLCSYVSNQKVNLENHLRTHTGEKPFTCPHCPFRANVRSNLKRHVLRCHELKLLN